MDNDNNVDRDSGGTGKKLQNIKVLLISRSLTTSATSTPLDLPKAVACICPPISGGNPA